MDRLSALLEIRFGYGLGPDRAPAPDAGTVLDRLAGPDRMAARFPIPGFDALYPEARRQRDLMEVARAGGEAGTAAREQLRALRVEAQFEDTGRLLRTLARAIAAEDQFRERLTRFWADHFTAVGSSLVLRNANLMYVEEAIRPNLTGRFADLLAAAILHPMMLVYLGQETSIGPGSPAAARRPGRGLNENLARELLELHTLGVEGAYSQADVRQLAELLAGITVDVRGGGTGFAPGRGEPGAETVLGVRYGGETPRMEDIRQALDDLAGHPDTARHIARKLAVHFVSDTPDPGLVDHLAGRFAETGGALDQVYAALLEHPSALDPVLHKAKQPFDFVASTLRALDLPADAVAGLDPKQGNRWLRRPMEEMGQPWADPRGPDGWAEAAEAWITPQGMAARITWALRLERLGAEVRPGAAILPDPRDLVQTALGPYAGPRLAFAAGAAETRGEGIALVLASPEFQRR